MPAYSAKPWPQGGNKGPQVPAGFDALDAGTECTEGGEAQNFFDAAEMHVDDLGYTMNGKDAKNGSFTGYPMPITSELEENTLFKDQASMAWDIYHAMADFNKGEDVSGEIGSVINRFLKNVSYSEDEEGNVTIIDGGYITGDDLQGVYDDFVALRDCVTPSL